MQDEIYATHYGTPRRSTGNSRVKSRIIVLNDAAKCIVEKHSGQSPDDFVFAVKRRNSNMVFRPVVAIRAKTSIEDFTFHQLRRTISTYLVQHLSPATAKAVLGHSDIKTTLDRRADGGRCIIFA